MSGHKRVSAPAWALSHAAPELCASAQTTDVFMNNIDTSGTVVRRHSTVPDDNKPYNQPVRIHARRANIELGLPHHIPRCAAVSSVAAAHQVKVPLGRSLSRVLCGVAAPTEAQ